MKGEAKSKRRLLVPEVVQTSAMDCGPASLKSLLEGFGVSVSYGRLREACQTDVDGTSIDTMEEVAIQLGLEAEQIMIPADHLLLAEADALPAIVVVALPNGLTHFVVVWNKVGKLVQVMDPGVGRRWPASENFLREAYIHRLVIPASDWREYAGSDDFLAPLRRRLSNVGLSGDGAKRLIDEALEDDGWHSLASLDATTRFIESIARSGGLRRGGQASRVLEAFFHRSCEKPGDEAESIPPNYWSVTAAEPVEGEQESLRLTGAVVVRARRRKSTTAPQLVEDAGEEAAQPAPLSPELVAALEEKPTRPGRDLLRLLSADGLLTPIALMAAVTLAAGGVVFEALLFRAFLDLGHDLGFSWQRLGAIGALFIFIIALLILELPIAEGMQRVGRHLEARLRVAFLEKIPRLGDRYFHSRLTSDMAERSHSVYALRLLPTMGGQLLRAFFGLLLTTAGVIWLDPSSAVLVIIVAAFSVGLPLVAQPIITERDLRVRTHAGALSRFYLDALLGLIPIRAHAAEQAIRREHEELLVEWVRANLILLRTAVSVDGVLALMGMGFSAWLLFNYLDRAGDAGGALLLIYWALSIPAMGQVIALTAQQYPIYRNVTLRLLEPLGAPEEAMGEDETAFASEAKDENAESKVEKVEGCAKAVAIAFEGVSVKAAGHTILQQINLKIEAGSHIAIVGPSGAGKSSLVGILLGWHRPSAGRILIDGVPLEGAMLEKLRRQTAWVDPAVQLWNRSLLDNLHYGASSDGYHQMNEVIETASLGDVLKKLPDGFQTKLGEGGALVSGGEGQRVRLGRGVMRPGVRLVILDEPFRGMDREKRRQLLSRSLETWRDQTLICITHDVGETQAFNRVIVIEDGLIVEDDLPARLIEQPESRYRALLEAEKAVREGMWSSQEWRRLRIEDGQVIESRSGNECER